MRIGYTPGPWKVGELVGLDMDERAIESAEGPTVCAVWQISPDFDEPEISAQREENAILIAAAPELVELLVELEDAAAVTSDSRVQDARRNAREILRRIGVRT